MNLAWLLVGLYLAARLAAHSLPGARGQQARDAVDGLHRLAGRLWRATVKTPGKRIPEALPTLRREPLDLPESCGEGTLSTGPGPGDSSRVATRGACSVEGWIQSEWGGSVLGWTKRQARVEVRAPRRVIGLKAGSLAVKRLRALLDQPERELPPGPIPRLLSLVAPESSLLALLDRPAVEALAEALRHENVDVEDGVLHWVEERSFPARPLTDSGLDTMVAAAELLQPEEEAEPVGMLRCIERGDLPALDARRLEQLVLAHPDAEATEQALARAESGERPLLAVRAPLLRLLLRGELQAEEVLALVPGLPAQWLVRLLKMEHSPPSELAPALRSEAFRGPALRASVARELATRDEAYVLAVLDRTAADEIEDAALRTLCAELATDLRASVEGVTGALSLEPDQLEGALSEVQAEGALALTTKEWS